MNELTDINWLAVIVGTVLAFGLGMVWFSPAMFGRIWSAGSHNIKPPPSPPVAAMATQLAGTFLLALVIAMTETYQAILAATVAILAAAVLQTANSLFSQKTTGAALVDGGYVVAMGLVMILCQGLF